MSSRRFMINSRVVHKGFAAFNGDLFRHIVRVLRMGTGDALTLVDEKGKEHQGIINQVDREWVVIKIIENEEETVLPEASGPLITICQALPKGEKTDLVLQKCTELGAHDFRMFAGRRSVARVRDDQHESKLERWNRITAEAARQSHRSLIPPVAWFPNTAEAAKSSSHDLRLLLWEEERKQSLKQALSNHLDVTSVVVAIGPEGGFDPQEIEIFIANGFQSISLGSGILRTETAAIAATAILQYALGDI